MKVFLDALQVQVKAYIKAHPAGVTSVVTSVAVIVAKALGVDLTPAEAAIIIGGVTGGVSHNTPRQ